MLRNLSITLMAIAVGISPIASSSCTRIVSSVHSNPNAKIVSRSVSANDIRKIKTSQAINVIYTQAKNTSVTVSAPEDIMQYVDVSINNGELNCKIKSNIETSNNRINVTVASPNITVFQASSASSISIKSDLNAQEESITISASSAATINADVIKAKNIIIETSNAANVKISKCIATSIEAESSSASTIELLSGKADKVRYDASSAGNIKAGKLSASTGLAYSSSGGNINCNIASPKIEESSGGNVNNRP